MSVKNIRINKRNLLHPFNNLNKKIGKSLSSLKVRRKNNIINNKDQLIKTKPYINNKYFKDPYFLNEQNLGVQLKILRTIGKNRLSLHNLDNIETNKETLPSLREYMENEYGSYRRPMDSDDFYYKKVFKMKPLFKTIRPLVDNKLNMKYAENEEQYNKIVERERILLLSQGKKAKSKKPSKKSDMKMNKIKKRIKFMKGVMDFIYPGYVLTKIRAVDKQLKRENELHNKLHEYISPVVQRNINKNKRNNELKKYLYECIKIKTDNF